MYPFCSFLFGIEAISKFLKRDTIILKKTQHEENIPSPAIAIVPNWDGMINPIISGNCSFDEQFWECVNQEDFTYPSYQILMNENETWNRKFDISNGFFYTRNTSFKMTSNEAESYKLVLNYMQEPLYGIYSLSPIIIFDNKTIFPRNFRVIGL